VRWRTPVTDGGIRSLLFTPDGKRVLAGGNCRVLAFDARSGKASHPPEKSELAGTPPCEREDKSFALAVSPDGRLGGMAGWRALDRGDYPKKVREIQLWEVATGKLRRRIPDEDAAPHISERRARYQPDYRPEYDGPLLVAFAPDGKTLAWNQGEAIEL